MGMDFCDYFCALRRGAGAVGDFELRRDGRPARYRQRGRGCGLGFGEWRRGSALDRQRRYMAEVRHAARWLYKTTDGCKSWKLEFTNPDKDGFWDAMLLNRFDKDGYLLGDPVNNSFRLWTTDDKGATWQSDWQGADWKRTAWKGLGALPDEGAFAASNSVLLLDERYAVGFVTGGSAGGRLILGDNANAGSRFHAVNLPLRTGSATSGAYSIASRDYGGLIVVGGDYLKPNGSSGTAAYSADGGEHWLPAQTPPHGYRSAVAYDAETKTWITVGPNGTDISTDDGRNWRALRPNSALGEAADADRDWNALSLPFVVGPHGRIGRLYSQALHPMAH